jgi:hypothetical protein
MNRYEIAIDATYWTIYALCTVYTVIGAVTL